MADTLTSGETGQANNMPQDTDECSGATPDTPVGISRHEAIVDRANKSQRIVYDEDPWGGYSKTFPELEVPRGSTMGLPSRFPEPAPGYNGSFETPLKSVGSGHEVPGSTPSGTRTAGRNPWPPQCSSSPFLSFFGWSRLRVGNMVVSEEYEEKKKKKEKAAKRDSEKKERKATRDAEKMEKEAKRDAEKQERRRRREETKKNLPFWGFG